MTRRLGLLVGLVWTLDARATPATEPAEPAPDPAAVAASVDRLAGLCRAWGHAELLHPVLARRPELDWDAAFVAAVPRVLAAESSAEYAAAVEGMLAALEDPVTRVRESDVAGASAGGPLAVELTRDGVLSLRIGDYYSLGGAQSAEALDAAIAHLAEARTLVLDLRSAVPTDAYAQFLLDSTLGRLEPLISRRPRSSPGLRRRVHYGFASSTPFASGQYRSGFLLEPGEAIAPAGEARDLPVVFLLDERSRLLPSIASLQAAGLARVVLEGERPPAATGTVEEVALGEGWHADLRVAEPVDAHGRSAEIVADVRVVAEPGDDDAALAKAVELAAELAEEPMPGSGTHPGDVDEEPPGLAPRSPPRYGGPPYPGLGERLLAACRIHATIDRFYPYKDLLDDDWDAVLREQLPRFAEAADALDYSLAVARMATDLHDSHAYVAGGVFSRDFLGEKHPPVRVRIVEGRPVVTAFFDAAAAREAGVEVGDVVLTVDGEDALERLERYRRHISGSTSQSRLDKAALAFLNGPEGSVITLRLEGGGGERTVRLERRHRFEYHRERSGEVFRVLPGNVGYADLDRLAFDQVGGMFQRFRDTRAIVFDMRGYPQGTAWVIAPRLTAENDVPAALFSTPLVGHPEPAASRQVFVQRIPPAPAGAWIYDRPTVLLIDERTQSQAEHTGLLLKAANGTVFVGSPTAGANGEITVLSVPGGITVGFTGQAVEYPDGRQLQRIGLVPDLLSRPTIAGLRAGRDEVLEAALAYLRSAAGSTADP